MKKLFYLFMALLISQNLLAQTVTKTWRGTTSTSWATASNWSPSGVPTASDVISIDNVANDPVIASAVTATCKLIYLNSSAILTISSGGTLTVAETSASSSGNAAIACATGAILMNNGSLNVTSNASGISFSNDNVSFTNNGTVTFDVPTRTLFFRANNPTITNNGTMTMNGTGVGFDFVPSTITGTSIVNTGTINHNSTSRFITLLSSNSFTNSGTINIAGTYIYVQGGTLTNQSCGKIYMGAGGDFDNSTLGSTVSNTGMISIAGTLNSTNGSFTNGSGGVLKYGNLLGSITKSNGSVIVNNNPTNTTIFGFTSAFTGSINGIFTNAAATTSAGAFAQSTSTFTPSGSLPSGSQTLYTKITPSGGACNYVVPFTYTYNAGPQRYYVKANATGSNNGTSWANAFTSLQSALAVATSIDEVWVAAGTYKPHASTKSIAFVIPSGLKVYGGFAGNESTLASRNMTLINTTNQTTLSGDLSSDDAGFSNQTENSYRVVTFLNAVSTTTLDGFRILGGNNTLGNTLSGYGGGIYNNGSGSGNSSNPTIANCTFTYCSAFLGGGMYNDGTSGGNASPSLTNCIFISNSADDSGAGLANYGTSGNSSPTISRCAFIGNSSVFNSGAMNNHGESGICSPTITNCIFIGNYAANNGGAMVNTGTNGGTSVPNITNCSFSGNRAANVGGVIRNNTANPVIKNSIMWGNSSLFDNNIGSVTATYSIVEGGYTGTGNLSTNPLFVTQPSFASAPTTTGDLHLTASSPAVNTGTNTGAPTTDLDGNTRPFTGTITDMGAYEFQGPGGCTQVATTTETMTWNGSVSTDWNNTCNWTPNGVPGAGNNVIISGGPVLEPEILSGYSVAIASITVQSNAMLTIAATSTLTVNGGVLSNGFTSSVTNNGTLQNSGTLIIGNNPSVSVVSYGIYNSTNGGFTNNSTGSIIIERASQSYIYQTAIGTGPFTNNGNITVGSSSSSSQFGIFNFATFNNTGTITINNFTSIGFYHNGGTLTNSGQINSTATNTTNKGFQNQGIVTNNACGKIIVSKGELFGSDGSITNMGLIQIENNLNNTRPFTNNGVLKYGSISGAVAITNNQNSSIIVKNTPTPIFTYGGTYDGVVNGIYTNATATTSAGTFTAPNTFTPSGLPVGSQTLYAKITPSGGACNYVVPFTYNYAAPPTLTAGAVTNATTCGGATGSIAFTTTNVPDGTYSLTFTTTGTTSPQNVTVSGNAFTLSSLTAGSYNNFSLTVSGQTATTGTLSPAKIVANPASPTITAGTVTNPTTCGGANGSIPFTSTNLPNGTYSLSFTATGTGATTSPQNVTVSANTFNLTGLKAGTYSNFSVTNNGCTAIVNTTRVLTDPVSPTIAFDGGNYNPTSCGGTNGFIGFNSTNLPNSTYILNYSKGGVPTSKPISVGFNVFYLDGLNAGVYSAFSVTYNGCTASLATPKTITDPATPTLTAGTVTNTTTCGGANGSIPFTTTNLPNGTYSLSFTATGTGATTSPQNITVSGNAFTLSGLKAGTYSNFSVTNNGCTGTVATSKVIADPAAPTLTAGTSTNPTTCGGTNGVIPFTSTNLPNGTYSLSFTATGAGATTSPQSVTVSANAFSLSGLKAGTYSAFSITSAGCTGTVATSKVLTDPAAPTLTAGTAVNPTTCAGANGSIPFTSTNLPNGTYSLSFTATGAGATTSPQSITVSANAFTLSGLKAGTYSAFSVTSAGCTGTVATSKVLTDPAAPTLTAGTAVNPTTCGGANGSIPFTSTNLTNGTYSLSFTATGTGATISPKSITVSGNAFSLTGLKAGTYSAFSVTNAASCTGTVTTSKTLSDPVAPTLTAGTATNPTTCGGTGSIAFTSTNLLNGTYSLSFTGTGSPKNVTVSANTFTLTSLTAGTYSNFSLTTTAGCTGTVATPKTLTDPIAPTLTVGTSVNPTTCGGANGSIPFTSSNLPNGTYSLSFTATGTGVTTSPKSITVSANVFSLSGLKAGNYSNFALTTVAGCTGTVATPKTLTDPTAPTLTAGTSVNPSTCAGANGSIPFTSTNLPNGTYSLSFTATGTGATTSPKSITVSANTFSLTGLKAGTYSNFSLTTVAGCTGSDASSKILTDPATLTISAGTVVNPATCGATGSIPFTATNLPNGTYSLSFTATGTGATSSPRNVTVSSNTFSLTNLSVGSYSNFSLTSTGCIGTDATSKTIVNPTTPTLVAGTVVNPTSCGGTDGAIPFTTNLPDGTYSLTYTGTGSPKSITVNGGTFTLGNLGSGGYSNFSVTNNGCIGTASTSKSLSDPAAPVLALGATTNPSACNLADGTIAFTTTNIADGTFSLTYSGAGNPKSVTVGANTFTLSGLADGVYSNFSITNESGCTGSLSGSVTLVDLALPVLTVGTATNPTTCAGTQGTIAFTSANLPDGTYSLSFSSTGTPSPQNITVASNAFTLSGLSAGTYNSFSVTRLGCTGSVSTSKVLVDPATPTLTVGVSSSPSTCAGTDGSINFTTTNLANGTYSLSFTSTGTVSPKSVTVTNNVFTLSGLTAGNYSNFSITNNGCSGTDATSKTLTDPPSITLAVGTSTNPTTCSGTNGSINFTTANLPNGTYTLTYTGAGSPKTATVATNAFSISDLSAGAYSNFSITYLGCTGSDAQTKTLFDPESATITAGTVTNPSTCSGTDGSIAFTSTNLPDGNYSLAYTGTGSPQTVTVSGNTFTLTGLSAGSYSSFSLVSSSCTAIDPSTKNLVAPITPTLTAGTVTNPSICNGTDGSIAFTTSLPNGTYSLVYTGAGSPQNITVVSGAFTLTGLPNGVYANFSIISNGCTAIDATSKTLVDPATPTLTVGTVTNPSTCNGTDGSIAFTTSLVDGTYSLVYTGANSPQNITVASGTFTLTGLQDGVYANFSITSSGCVAVASTSKTLVDPAIPTLTAGTVTNPSICSGTDGTIAFTTSLPDGTYRLNYTGVGSPTTITVVSGAFSLTGLSSGTYSGFSVSTNGCTGTDATAKTLTEPSAPTLTAGTVTNPTTCLSSDGKIAFTTSLPNGTYTLNYTGTGSPKSITVVSGVFELTGLSDGTFSGFSIITNGCTGTDATTKTLTDPAAPTLTAGTATNPSTCLSADGSIAFTTSLPNGTYTLNYTGNGSPKSITVVSGAFTLTGLPDGIFSGFSVSTGGCTGVSSSNITLTDPATPTITAGTATSPSACNGADGSIAFTTSLPNGNYTLNYTGSGSPKTITVVNGVFTLTGLLSGDYSGFSVTTGGCNGIDNTNKTLVNPNPPTLSVGTATNPSTCLGTGNIAFTTNLPNGTYNLTYTGTGNPKSITVNNGIFTLSGLLAGTYSNFSIDNNLGCVGTDATSKTLTDPLTPTLTIGTQTNPSTCSGTDGSIAFTTNLPNGTYSLAYTGVGSPKSVTVSNGVFTLSGLSAGTYGNFIITVNGCTGNETSSKVLTNPNAPVVEITGNENLNCTTLSVSRTASVVGTYLWSNGSTSATINVSTAGIYTVTVTGNSGCTATATTNVSFTNNLETSASNNGPYQIGNTIELNAIGITTANYAWAGPNSFISTAQNPSISGALVVNAGVYTVTVSIGACSATATTNVVIEAGLDPCIPIIDYQFVRAGNPYQPLFSLTNGLKINQLNDPVSIIAVPICQNVNIESLLMKIQGPNMNEEIIQNVSPYAIFDNTENSVNGRVLIPGVYTITVTGYNQDNLLGSINYGPVITTFTVLPNMASITTPTISNTVLCGGSSFEVNFSANGIFSPTNQFRVELSDANGNFVSSALLGNTGNSAYFTSPIIIGTTNSAGIINCLIPSNLEGGTNYRIRVISTDGVSVSTVNSSSITIHPKDLNLVSPTDDFTTNIGTKQASNKVTASNKVSSTSTVTYQAGKAIILNVGFEANAGTVFKAEIRGCN